MSHVTLELVDREDALSEGASVTRGELFRKGAFGAGAMAAGGLLLGGLPNVASAQGGSARRDVAILNFALLLEFLEAAFYADALAKGALADDLLGFAEVVGAHEATHVEFLQTALGDAAIESPTFDFGDSTATPEAFAATAVALEDTGVSAYNGQGTRLRRATLGAAASIVSVEARHAAWIRHLTFGPEYDGGRRTYPAPATFDRARTQAQVVAIVEGTGFIAGAR